MAMVVKRFVFLMAIVFAGLFAHAQKETKQGDEILFTVNKKPVSADEFIYLYKKNHQGKPDEFTEKKIKEYLDLFINFKLKVAEAKNRGLDTTTVFRNEFASYRDELKKPFTASGDELGRLVQEVYDRLSTEVNASHLLISLSPDATPQDTLAAFRKIEDIRKRIVGGASFEQTAREVSEDPSAKMNGGSLGYFTAMQMVYQFEDAAYRLNPGEVSGPVRTRFGYHLIKLNDKRPASGEVEVSHILLRGRDSKAKDKAFNAYDQLKAGRPWEEVCAEFSEDDGTKAKGGRLSPFGVGAIASVPEFEAVAFSMEPGEVSDPFESSIGWHIIRMEKKISLPSFQELEPSLKRRVARDERLQVNQALQLSRRKKEFMVEEKMDVIHSLSAQADTTLQYGHWNAVTGGVMNDAILFNVSGEPVYVREFFSYVKDHQRQSALSPAAYFTELYNQFVDARLATREDAQLQLENPEYRNLLKEYYEGILLFSIMETEVWNRASEDTVGQRNFYNQHAEKYKAGERLYARIFVTPTESVLKETREKINKGDTLSSKDIARFKSVSGFRAYEKGENTAIDKITWSAGIHETEAEGMYYLVEAERLIPAGNKSIEEARANVISDYQDELEKTWVARLKKKYPVKVSKKVVRKVVANLENK